MSQNIGIIKQPLLKMMLMRLGDASPELAEKWLSLARESNNRSVSSVTVELEWKGEVLYGSATLPTRGCVSDYIIGNRSTLELLSLLGEFDYPEDPYMLVSERVSLRPGAPMDEIDEAELESLGAHLLYDARKAPLENVEGSSGKYEYTGDGNVDQDIIDMFVHHNLTVGARSLAMESIRNAIMADPPHNRELLERMEAMFGEDPSFGGENAIELLKEDCEMAAKTQGNVGFFSLVLDESLASDGVARRAKIMRDLYMLLTGMLDNASDQGEDILLSGSDSFVMVNKKLRGFAEDQGWDSMVDAYNSGVPVDDIIA